MTQSGDAVEITRMSLRTGGWIGYTADALYIERDNEKIQIGNEHIREIALRSLRWDVAIMSALLIGLGGYVVVIRNPLVGVAFAVIGALSLYRTYTKRYALVLRVENEPKPVVVHPTHPKKCHETLVASVGAVTPGNK